MPDLRAGSIAQIQDFSSRSGEKLVDILGKQLPTASILNDLVGKATRAWDSDQMAKASALQETMMGLGYGPEKIRAALTGAGFRAGIVGSKELQDRYEEGEATRIAKEAHDNTMRVAGLKEQASSLLSDFTRFVSTYGPHSAVTWLKSHPEYAQNPYASKDITAFIQSNNLNITPTSNTDKADILKTALEIGEGSSNQEKTNKAYKTVLLAKEKLAAEGLTIPSDPKERLAMENTDAFIEKEAKNLGYLDGEWGWLEENDSSKYEDFRDNVLDAKTKIEHAIPGVPPQIVHHVIKTNLRSGFGPFSQPSVSDINKAIDQARGLMALWDPSLGQLVDVEKHLSILKAASEGQTPLNTSLKAKKLLSQLEAAIKAGDLTREQADEIYARNIIEMSAQKAAIDSSVKFGDMLEKAAEAKKQK